MTKLLTALALLAALTCQQVTAHEPAPHAPIIRNADTDDAAIRLSNGQWLQLEHAARYLTSLGDCTIIPDDGSLDCN